MIELLKIKIFLYLLFIYNNKKSNLNKIFKKNKNNICIIKTILFINILKVLKYIIYNY